jgi:hypothetical protein
VKSVPVKTEWFQSQYSGTSLVNHAFEAYMQKLDRSLSGKAAVPAVEAIEAMAENDKRWQLFEDGPIAWRLFQNRRFSVIDDFPGLTADEVLRLSCGARQLFSCRANINTLFQPSLEDIGDDKDLRLYLDDWAFEVGEDTKAFFDSARRRRVGHKKLNNAEPAGWLIAMAATQVGARFVSATDCQSLFAGVSAITLTLVFTQAAQVFNRVQAASWLRTEKIQYQTSLLLKCKDVGARVKDRQVQLTSLLDKCVKRYVTATDDYYALGLDRAIEMERRWSLICEQLVARIEALRDWFELTTELYTERFRQAYTTGRYHDHYWSQGFPIRALPRNGVGLAWRLALAVGAAVSVGAFGGLGIWANPQFTVPHAWFAASMAAFGAAYTLNSTRSWWYSTHFDKPASPDDFATQVAEARAWILPNNPAADYQASLAAHRKTHHHREWRIDPRRRPQ